MADLEFYWGVMGSGKSTQLLQTVYDYRKQGKSVLVIKPDVDTRKNKKIHSRLGNGAIDITVDFSFNSKENLFELILKEKQENNELVAIFIDEAQFLTENQVFQLMEVVTFCSIDVKAYGLRSQYDGYPFTGSSMLFANATKVERITTDALCRLSKDVVKKGTSNLRTVNGIPTFTGEDIIIDDGKDSVEYLPVSLEMWVRERVKSIGFTKNEVLKYARKVGI